MKYKLNEPPSLRLIKWKNVIKWTNVHIGQVTKYWSISKDNVSYYYTFSSASDLMWFYIVWA